MKYARIIAAVVGQPWVIHPDKGRAIMKFLTQAALGVKQTPEAIEEAKRMNPRTERKVATSPGGVALIPVHGILSQRATSVDESSGMSSMDKIGRSVMAAAADESIKTIILDIESPGGTVYGTNELADRIFEARQSKPVIAVANSYAASAAYWIGSQATELVVAPGGDVGSIGAYMMHEDISGMLDAMGVKETLISAGKFKVEGNPFEPLTDEAKEMFQTRVDAAYKDFTNAVARGRGVDVSTVKKEFGQGRMVQYDEAVSNGMADRVATLDETLSRFVGSPADHSAQRARLALSESV